MQNTKDTHAKYKRYMMQNTKDTLCKIQKIHYAKYKRYIMQNTIIIIIYIFNLGIHKK